MNENPPQPIIVFDDFDLDGKGLSSDGCLYHTPKQQKKAVPVAPVRRH
jgi:hypothetical protein